MNSIDTGSLAPGRMYFQKTSKTEISALQFNPGFQVRPLCRLALRNETQHYISALIVYLNYEKDPGFLCVLRVFA